MLLSRNLANPLRLVRLLIISTLSGLGQSQSAFRDKKAATEYFLQKERNAGIVNLTKHLIRLMTTRRKDARWTDHTGKLYANLLKAFPEPLSH